MRLLKKEYWHYKFGLWFGKRYREGFYRRTGKWYWGLYFWFFDDPDDVTVKGAAKFFNDHKKQGIEHLKMIRALSGNIEKKDFEEFDEAFGKSVQEKIQDAVAAGKIKPFERGTLTEQDVIDYFKNKEL
jgi:hypothetical protein